MKTKDEFKSCRYYDNDYTIKTYQKEDCKYYAIVLYETDEESKVVYRTKPQINETRANKMAIEHIDKYKRLR